MNFAQKYVLSIKVDTLDQAAEEALHLAYIFVMRALQEHRSQGRNGSTRPLLWSSSRCSKDTDTCTPICRRHSKTICRAFNFPQNRPVELDKLNKSLRARPLIFPLAEFAGTVQAMDSPLW